MRKWSIHLFAFGASFGLMTGASAGFAQDKTMTTGGLPVSGINSHRFFVQYESGPPPAPVTRPAPRQAAGVGTRRETKRARSHPPQPSPTTTRK